MPTVLGDLAAAPAVHSRIHARSPCTFLEGIHGRPPLAASGGVAYAALAMTADGDFRTAIILVALPLALTTFLSLRLSKEDGAEIAGRTLATKKS